MPIQAPQWTDYLNCPACCREFSPRRSPVSLSCGHTLCRPCLKNLIRKQCPFDQSVISMDLEELVVNTALLQLMGYDPPAQPSHPSCIQSLSEQDRRAYDVIVKSLEQLAVFLKYCCTASVNMIGSRLSRPMQRKLVTLLQCALMDEEGRGKAARAARSLGERTVSELILQHQNPQQLSVNLWAAVRSRGCQFLGPAMQEEVLKLVLLALEDGSPLSRKVLVMFVVQRLEPHFPQASKTSIGHVVQLLYRASCFKVSKRDSDSSLMQLKEEFRTYECLRREHDAQIVQIATESGLRIAPDQWSALLYGDTLHKSHMQSIIDKLQTPHSFAQSVQELFFALQRTGDPAQLLVMSISLDRLTNIDPGPDAKSPSWLELSQIMSALKDVVSGLVDYMQHHAAARDANHNLKTDRLTDANSQPSTISNLHPGRYKVAICRDAQTRSFCPRGNNCTYAHTEEELERYRRQEPSNVAPLPPTPTSRMVPPPGPINYPPPNNRMPLQLQSPSGRQHGMLENSNGPDELDRRSTSFERHQIDQPAPAHQPGINMTYANALMYGGPNNRQHENQNGGASPQVGGKGHPSASLSPMDGAIRHPTDGLGPMDGGIRHPSDGLGPKDGGIRHPSAGLGPKGGGIRHPSGALGPMDGGIRHPSGGLSPMAGGIRQHSGGGLSPMGGSIQFHRGLLSPMVGGIRHPSGGLSPMGGIIRYPNGELHQLHEGMINHNRGISPMSPYNGGMRPLNGGMVNLNEGIGLLNTAPQYGGSFSPHGHAINRVNVVLPPNHKPPTDSRYFPRQPFEKTGYREPESDSARMVGDVPAYQGVVAVIPPSNVPDFSMQEYRVPAELLAAQGYGQGSNNRSKLETTWQTAPPIEDAQRQNKFTFNYTVKNLPEGIHPNDELPMGINLTKPQPQAQTNFENQFIGSNYTSMNYNQPMIDQYIMPRMPATPGSSDYMPTDSIKQEQYSESDTNAVLDDLHSLAVRVTSECSDSDTEME